MPLPLPVGTAYLLLDVTVLVLVASIIHTYIIAPRTRHARHPYPYPPGPRGLPLLGNLLDIPRSKPWVTYAQWGKRYGTYNLTLSACGRERREININIGFWKVT